ncbi:MAG: hypothetical protein P8J30_03960 [Ilumatobacter sp.]|nr:hypothetical protein [Ilumatobacter sp.]
MKSAGGHFSLHDRDLKAIDVIPPMTQSTPEKEWLPFHRAAILRKHLLMCIPASSGTPSGLVTACTSWPG